MERFRPVLAGAMTALVGFSSSFTVVLAGLRAVGASEQQAASGLLALCVLMGLLGIALSLRHRMPISVAWSTPGAALLVSMRALHGGFATAVAAFAICGLLTIVTGALPRLRALVLSIPRPIAHGVLAGVLLGLCATPVLGLTRTPGEIAPVVLSWLVLGRLARRWAVPGAMAVALVEIAARAHGLGAAGASLAPSLTVTVPSPSVAALALGVSLFVVTMASQNVPGLAVLDGFGYRPPVGETLVDTGAATVAGALLGGHVVNLAAISAALCAGPEAGEDRARRFVASSVAGGCYVLLGLAAGLLSALVAHAPTAVVETVAALALLPALGSSLATATEPGDAPARRGEREAAVLTLVVTASGASPLGIGAPFWGLAGGLAALALGRLDTRLEALRSARDGSLWRRPRPGLGPAEPAEAAGR